MRIDNEARMSRYRDIRTAISDHIAITENGLRSLATPHSEEIERVLTIVQQQHEKLLRRIDRLIAAESAIN